MKLQFMFLLTTLVLTACAPPIDKKLRKQARANGAQAQVAFQRCARYVHAWMHTVDPETGLIPRNLKESRDVWNGRDAAADNYPYMVLSSYFTDPSLFNGHMKKMLASEARVTARHDRLPDNYTFSTRTWQRTEFSLEESIFDGAEYAKDGLIPITEIIGPSEWSDRMIGIVDDIWKNATVETPFGLIPSSDLEVQGDLLQLSARLFWFTGDRKYLDWGIRLGDFFLLGEDNLPTRQKEFGFSDHGCEVINGLSELYLTCAYAAPEKREAYRASIHEMYDRILEVAINEHGLVIGFVNMVTGEHEPKITDNWGYNLDGIYTAYLVDGTPAYREVIQRALGNLLAHYVGYPWQGGGMDGYADSIEGAITLFNREPIPSAGEWIDSEIQKLWNKQKKSGFIEKWHCDGNFARTLLMYAFWKTQGCHVQPWRPDVRVGAVRDGNGIVVYISADEPWQGRLVFDRPRHREYFNLPVDYPRINQFPEWFTVESNATYRVSRGLRSKNMAGQVLRDGLEVNLAADQRNVIRVALR